MRRWIAIAERVARQPSALGRFAVGALSGVRARGAIVERQPAGPWSLRDKFGRARVEGGFRNGMPHGRWVEWGALLGGPYFEATFEDGRCRSLRFWIRDLGPSAGGRERGTALRGEWLDGLAHGEWIHADEHGGLDEARSGTYERGERIRPAPFAQRWNHARDANTRAAIARELVARSDARARAGDWRHTRDIDLDETWTWILAGDDDKRIRGCVSDCARRLLRERTAVELEALRRGSSESLRADARRAEKIERLQRLVSQAGAGPLADVPYLAWASFDPDGFVRDAAVRHLAARSDTEAVGCLLVRASDWVEPVRRRALAALNDRIDERHALELARELPTIEALAKRARFAQTALGERIEALWSTPAGLMGLRAHVGSIHRVTRRAAARRLFAHTTEFAADAEMALRSHDEVVRLAGARALLAQSGGATLEVWIERLALDKAMNIRREALRRSWSGDASVGRYPFEPALLDRHASIRELARFHARSSGALDPAAFYRATFVAEHGERRFLALLGWLETAQGDEAVNRAHAELETSTGRRARVLIEALTRRKGAVDRAKLFEWLASDERGRSRAAARALEVAGATSDDARDLELLAKTDARVHVIENVARIARQLGKWNELGLLLSILARADDLGRERALAFLSSWRVRNLRAVVRLPDDERRTLSAKLAAARELDADMRRELAADIAAAKLAR